MNGTIYFRADHELIGRVLAIKERQRLERHDFADPIRPAERRVRAAGGVG